MKPIIFTYWEGEKPPYIELCEDIISRKTRPYFHYVPVTDQNLFNYIERHQFPDNFFHLSLAHKADYLRCELLTEHGGIWLDSDQILTSDMSSVIPYLQIWDYVGYEWEPLSPSLGFMGARKQCPLLVSWREKMKAMIKIKATFGWEELGYQVLHPLLKHMVSLEELNYMAFDAKTSFAPIYWKNWETFFDTRVDMVSSRYSVMLYNSQFPNWFKKMSAVEILRQDYLISRLFRRCF